MEVQKIAARNLTRLRNKRGWSARELAEAVASYGGDISRSTLAKIEAGTRPMKLDELFTLAVSLGASPLSLLMPDDGEAFDAAPGAPLDGDQLYLWFTHMAPATNAVPSEMWTAAAPEPLVERLQKWTASDRARQGLMLAVADAVERGDEAETLRAAQALGKFTDLSEFPAEDRKRQIRGWLESAQKKHAERNGDA